MKQNSLIEIGSKGDIILKFNVDTYINGRKYKKGEPYLFIRDVNVAIRYGATNKEATKQQSIAAHSSIYPDTVSVTGVPFSRRIAALLADFSGDKEIFYKNEMKEIVSEVEDEDEYIIVDNFAEDVEFFLYNEDFEPIVPHSVNGSEIVIRKGEDLESKTYIIFYSSGVKGASFSLIKPHLPYMSLEVQGIGNINKKQSQVLMKFEKVSLESVLNFNFLEEGIIGAPLNFVILKGENEIWFEDNE